MKKTSNILNKSSTFVPTVHTTLPVRTASQGVSFAFYQLGMFGFTLQNPYAYV